MFTFLASVLCRVHAFLKRLLAPGATTIALRRELIGSTDESYLWWRRLILKAVKRRTGLESH